MWEQPMVTIEEGVSVRDEIKTCKKEGEGKRGMFVGVVACGWTGSQVNLSESPELVLEAGNLPGSKVIPARII